MGKYDHYFVTEYHKKDFVRPAHWPAEMETRLISMDDKVVPGSFYTECLWLWPGERPLPDTHLSPMERSHSHTFDEMIGFFGTNPDDPHDLGGEVELWIEDEQYILTKSFLTFVPAGRRHCPLVIRRVDRPIFHFTTGPAKSYEKQ